jgi:hypothetical protein
MWRLANAFSVNVVSLSFTQGWFNPGLKLVNAYGVGCRGFGVDQRNPTALVAAASA